MLEQSDFSISRKTTISGLISALVHHAQLGKLLALKKCSCCVERGIVDFLEVGIVDRVGQMVQIIKIRCPRYCQYCQEGG